MKAQEETYAIECLFCGKGIQFLAGYKDKKDRDDAFDIFLNLEKKWTGRGNEELISVKNPKKIILKRIYE